MPTPLRILRTQAQDFGHKPRSYTCRELDRLEEILATSERLLAANGRHGVTFASLAQAMDISPATLRRHFADLDALLGEILCRHMRKLFTALGAVPRDVPNRRERLCAAYLDATRLAFGRMTAGHLLLTRDRGLLPEDVLEAIEQTRHGVGYLIAGDGAQEVLMMLDLPVMTTAGIPAMLAFLAALEAPQVVITAETRAESVPDEAAPPAPRGNGAWGPNMPAHIIRDIENGDLSYLRPAGLGSMQADMAAEAANPVPGRKPRRRHAPGAPNARPPEAVLAAAPKKSCIARIQIA